MDYWSRIDRLKILYQSNTQANKYFMSSMSKRRDEVQDFVFHFLVVDEGLQLSLMMTSLVLLASEASDHASKEFSESTTNRIGR
jgi:hypothetical protein